MLIPTHLPDPTYVMTEINANPIWKFAFELSEIDNETAPIGWYRYVTLATWILLKFDRKKE